MSKERAWSQIIQEKRLDMSRTINRVSASQIKQITHQEPRLVASITQRGDLPAVLKRYGVFPLSVTNDAYVLVRGEGFHNLEELSGGPTRHRSSLTFSLETLKGSGEDPRALYALHSGLFSRFTGTPNWFLTRFGKQRSSRFSFRVGASDEITVEGVQIQVDLTLESENQITVTEAKHGQRDSFLIRQLYYPFRHWEQLSAKRVRALFFLYDEKQDLYKFWEYRFGDRFDYESIELVRGEKFRIEAVPERFEDLLKIEPIAGERLPEGFVRVPQANAVWRIQQLPLLVKEGRDDRYKIAAVFGIDPRQGDYYRDAAQGMGLVELRPDHKYHLTELGESYVRMSVEERNKWFARRLLQHPIMNDVLQQLARHPQRKLDELTLVRIIQPYSQVSGTTGPRRADTIRAWFRWLGQAIGFFTVHDKEIRLSAQRQETLE